jgi:hypothetical protein
MRKMLCALVVAILASQIAVPAFAADIFNLTANNSGWRRQGDGTVMAYMRMPLGNNRKSEAQPRMGIALVAGRSYDRNEVALHLNNPVILDIGFTGRSLTSPWAPTLNIGRTVTWTNNPDVLPPAQRVRFLEGMDWTWPVVGLATVGIGIFLATELD